MSWRVSASSSVILSFRVSRGRDLRRPVVDSVADGTLAARSRLFHLCGSLPDRVPCRPLVAECAGELAAEPGVLVGKLLVASRAVVSLARSDASVARWPAGMAAEPTPSALVRSRRIWPLMSGWV